MGAPRLTVAAHAERPWHLARHVILRCCWPQGAAALHRQAFPEPNLQLFALPVVRRDAFAESQEEVGELKAELRKLESEAKNVERRITVGISRGIAAERAGLVKPKVGDGDGVVPGKGAPHTPSKKLSEAKNR